MALPDIKSDNAAHMAGYTLELMAYSDMCDLHTSVKPETDLGDRFPAFCHDEQEMLYVNGWLFSFEPIA